MKKGRMWNFNCQRNKYHLLTTRPVFCITYLMNQDQLPINMLNPVMDMSLYGHPMSN